VSQIGPPTGGPTPWKTFSMLYLEVDGNFVVAGLESWLGCYSEWGPHFARFYTYLEIPMQWSELDWYGAHTYFVYLAAFSVLYLEEEDGNFAAILAS
jgi:hypothetical protein